MSDETIWEGGTPFVERQTKQIEREFGKSKPEPRQRKMGFKADPNRKRVKVEYWKAYVRSDSW